MEGAGRTSLRKKLLPAPSKPPPPLSRTFPKKESDLRLRAKRSRFVFWQADRAAEDLPLDFQKATFGTAEPARSGWKGTGTVRRRSLSEVAHARKERSSAYSVTVPVTVTVIVIVIVVVIVTVIVVVIGFFCFSQKAFAFFAFPKNLLLFLLFSPFFFSKGIESVKIYLFTMLFLYILRKI